jgi:hypothetical protein
MNKLKKVENSGHHLAEEAMAGFKRCFDLKQHMPGKPNQVQ